MKNKKNVATIFVFVFAIFITCCLFPLLNLTKETPIRLEMINWIVIAFFMMSYYQIGQMQAKLLPHLSLMIIIVMNLLAVLSGLSCRFLIEFGEVSNTYNFTMPNILLHIAAAVALISATWVFSKKATNRN